ncbi:Deoxyhypusine hydroxylase [Blattella germanica]|nr:Deoxyhypusine hydroxylase [Blattella germanica]
MKMPAIISEDKVIAIGEVLKDQTRPLKERFRALFTLRNIGGPVAIKCIQECFDDPSALLKHELAYCLGQMQDNRALPILKQVLSDRNQEPMVRHEAAEALGAIGSPDVKEILEKYSQDEVVEVSETCQLALGRIKWLAETAKSENLSENPYASVDPAPPSLKTDVDMLKKILLDENESLFERYRAMFSLRNLNTKESISALGEVCYDILKKYLDDEKRVVKESCEIALDMCEYENSPEFQYADTLLKVQ